VAFCFQIWDFQNLESNFVMMNVTDMIATKHTIMQASPIKNETKKNISITIKEGRRT